MNYKWKLSLSFLVVMATLLVSCQKEEVVVDFLTSENETAATDISNSIDDDVDIASFKSSGVKPGNLPSCVTITETYPNGGSYPKVITIDYGPTNCYINNMRYKRGKIIVTLSDDFVNTGAQRTVTFDDYYVNDKEVTGSKSSTNLGANANGNIEVSYVSNIVITDDNGNLMSRQHTGNKEWVAGFGTTDRTDDLVYISGSGSMTRPDGSTSSKNITTPLLWDGNCGYIVSGVSTLVKANGTTVTIDFGNGTCDNLATVNKNGTQFIIDLDQHKIKRRK